MRMPANMQAQDAVMAEVEAAVRSIPVAANPTRVRRTQRIVRERAMRMKDGRARFRFTVAICAVCSLLLGSWTNLRIGAGYRICRFICCFWRCGFCRRRLRRCCCGGDGGSRSG
jgi:hypothetical protein